MTFSWYTFDPFYDTILTFALIYILLVIIGSNIIKAPYGRFASDKFGILIPSNWGWFLMEAPASISFILIYFKGNNWSAPVPLFFLVIWILHYANRGFAFPLLMKVPKGEKNFSLFIVFTGWFTTLIHGFLNARYISHFAYKFETLEWFTEPRFIIGITIYFISFAINLYSDSKIRNLRTQEEITMGIKKYRIPTGGLYTFITNPNYLSELLCWAGLAIATWSFGFIFILGVSAANLIPRAIQTHRWYKDTFPDYPLRRKILIPFIW